MQQSSFKRVCSLLGKLPSTTGSATFYRCMEQLLVERAGEIEVDIGHPLALTDEVLAQMSLHPDILFKCMISSLLNQTNKLQPYQLYNNTAASYKNDWQVAKLRKLLVDRISNTSDSYERGLSIQLLLRIGVLCGSPEDLLLAAKFQ